jgi:hypothetical protein
MESPRRSPPHVPGDNVSEDGASTNVERVSYEAQDIVDTVWAQDDGAYMRYIEEQAASTSPQVWRARLRRSKILYNAGSREDLAMHQLLYSALCISHLRNVRQAAMAQMFLDAHATLCGWLGEDGTFRPPTNDWKHPADVSASKLARFSDVLQPRYKWKKRMPKLNKGMRAGRLLGSAPSRGELNLHRMYNEYIMQRLIQRMTRSTAREAGSVRTVRLTEPKEWKSNGSVAIRSYEPRMGAFSKPREVRDVAFSRHFAEKFIETPQTPGDYTHIDRLAAIVRYSSHAKKGRTLEMEASIVRKIIKKLCMAFDGEVSFPEAGQNVLIRGQRARSTLIPALWHNKEEEIRVSRERFMFPGPASIQRMVDVHAVAEAFTAHISGHARICRDLNLNPAYLVVGVDAMGCNWDRMVAYVRDVQQSLGRGFHLFIHVQQLMHKLCPRGDGKYRFGHVGSDQILAYHDPQTRNSLPKETRQALHEWQAALQSIYESNTAKQRSQILTGLNRNAEAQRVRINAALDAGLERKARKKRKQIAKSKHIKRALVKKSAAAAPKWSGFGQSDDTTESEHTEMALDKKEATDAAVSNSAMDLSSCDTQ